MNRLLAILAIASLIAIGSALAEESHKQSFTPSEVQSLRLQVKQRDAQIAQKDLFFAQQNFAGAVKALEEEGDRVKSENKWPATTQFDKDKLSFNAPPTIPTEPLSNADTPQGDPIPARSKPQ